MANRQGANGFSELLLVPTAREGARIPAAEWVAGVRRGVSGGEVGGLIASVAEETEALVRELRNGSPPSLSVIVPNMMAYVRDSTDLGQVGAALKRFSALGLSGKARVAVHQARNVLGVLTKDFATGVLILAEMEIVRWLPYRPTEIYLDGQLGDLALALGNRGLLAGFARLVQRTYGLKPGVMTNNYGSMIPWLEQTGVPIHSVIAPFNPKGYLMGPDRHRCEEVLRGSRVRVIADRIDADGTIAAEESAAYLQRLGIRHVLRRPAP